MSLPAELLQQLRPSLDPSLGDGASSRAKALPLSSSLVRTSTARASSAAERALSQAPEVESLDDVLPDGGLPRGAVVEIAGARGLGRATGLALRACAAAQAEARARTGDPRTPGAWCAFLDPWSTLHAPGVARSGVDPARLLVVRAPEDALARVAVRIAESRAFTLITIDTAGVPGSATLGASRSESAARRVRLDRWGTVVRRLALAIERTDTAVLVLTDVHAHRSMPLPVAMRLELDRRGDRLTLRVAKDRHGRVGAPRAVAI
ncbi:MAG TPA: recombinase A [Polyangiaceae bacterium]|jgi:recombination protein RecA|nr:recombinase A [Polyangiaceae bacterium]